MIAKIGFSPLGTLGPLPTLRHFNGAGIGFPQRSCKAEAGASLRFYTPSVPMDKDRHLIDCMSYIHLEDPRFIDPRGGLSMFEPIYPSLAY